MWLKDSVKFINTYRVDLASPEGQKFMAKQCAIYFGFEEGDAAQTAFVARRRSDKKELTRTHRQTRAEHVDVTSST